MLEPQERSLLLESLRPPLDYRLDFAIATTFTLDLLSLLTAPLGFTFFDLEGSGSEATSGVDPLLLLRTIREYADRMVVFCHTGRIAVPPTQQLLFANLEHCVVEVTAPTRGGLFHPKVWVLRFTATDERSPEAAPVCYRLICLTRNLTFDRSWDLVVSMDGDLVDRQRAFAANHPLGDFIAALPGLAVDRKRIPKRILTNIATAADELRRVDFQPPEPFKAYALWPLGLPNYRKSDLTTGRSERTLVVSPFLGAGALEGLAAGGRGNVLISRADSLQTLSKSELRGYKSVYVLDSSAQGGPQNTRDAADDPTMLDAGLHAKLFVHEAGWDASVFVGSANATDAALSANVEFVVELVGKKSECGIAAMLEAPTGVQSFRDILQPFEPLDDPIALDEVAESLRVKLETAQDLLSSRSWIASAERQSNGEFAFRLAPEKGVVPAIDPSIKGSCRPITVPAAKRPLGIGETSLDFGQVPVEALTTFFAFELDASEAGQTMPLRFVITARLDGAPADRTERLLKYHLRDPDRVLRFLLLLLARDLDPAGESIMGDAASEGSGAAWRSYGSESLLEPLLRALATNPRALDQVARTLEELRTDDEGAALLPPGIDSIWKGIWAARQQLASKEP